jgi:excisionase family DNA binding protein
MLRENISMMLTPAEIAERYRISASLVYAWCAEGSLPHARLGKNGRRGKIVIEKSDLEAFLAERRVEGRQEIPPPAKLKHIRLS